MTEAEERIRNALFAMRDGKYAAFQQKLIPNIPPERVIGVRIPDLRAYAKRIAKTEDAAIFLAALPHRYYDENNLHAALLESIREESAALAAVETFLPFLDNWATCDSFCPKVLRNDLDRLWEKLLVWLASDKVYTVRFALVRLTAWYLDAPYFSDAILSVCASVRQEDYYVRMAQAWLFSIALVKQYDATLPYLTELRLPVWIHNKAIQKAVESYRISPERKDYLKTLRRPDRRGKE